MKQIILNRWLFNGYVSIALISTLLACNGDSKRTTYIGECEKRAFYRTVDFDELVNNLGNYHGQCISVKGKYKDGLETSQLYTESFFRPKSLHNSIWVGLNCRHYYSGSPSTANDLNLSLLNDRKIVISGIIDTINKGHLGQYKASITGYRITVVD